MFRQAELTADKLAAALRPLLADAAKRARDGRRDEGAREARAAAAVVDWATEAAASRRA